jgi:WD40 repeat protein
LNLIDADGTNPRLASSSNASYADSAPAWSPDSKWIVALSASGTLNLVEVATGTVLPLLAGSGYGSVSWK